MIWPSPTHHERISHQKNKKNNGGCVFLAGSYGAICHLPREFRRKKQNMLVYRSFFPIEPLALHGTKPYSSSHCNFSNRWDPCCLTRNQDGIHPFSFEHPRDGSTRSARSKTILQVRSCSCRCFNCRRWEDFHQLSSTKSRYTRELCHVSHWKGVDGKPSHPFLIFSLVWMILGGNTPPPRKQNMRTENPLFEDVFPIENGDVPMSC